MPHSLCFSVVVLCFGEGLAKATANTVDIAQNFGNTINSVNTGAYRSYACTVRQIEIEVEIPGRIVSSTVGDAMASGAILADGSSARTRHLLKTPYEHMVN